MIKTSSVYEIPANKYNDLLAKALKQIPEFKEPDWVGFVKTGVAKKRPSQEEDFWYKRVASVLRQIYINGVVGVNRLRTRYGSKKNRGMKPERFRKASGKIIRVILQQAETAGLLEKYNEAGKRAGRKVTEKGKEFLEGIGGGNKPITKESISIETQSNKKREAKSIESSSEKPITDIKIENKEPEAKK